MSIIDKANKYIGHPREVDEGYEVSMRRDAYAQGYQDAIEKACEWLKKRTYQDCLGVSPIARLKMGFSSVEELVDEFKKAMGE